MVALAPLPTARPQAVAGAASTALRGALDRRHARRQARVIAVFPAALYLELLDVGEPKVVALVASDAVRLPNAIVIGAAVRETPFAAVHDMDEAWIGDGCVEITGRTGARSAAGRLWPEPPLRLRVRVRRWWEPVHALAPTASTRLARQLAVAEKVLVEEGSFGLAGHIGPVRLAERVAAGDLARAVDAAEQIVGLGPGLTPSGDDVLAGMLAALRLLGEALPGGGDAVWLADWIGAAVTADARTRTTALAATLLHCAARGQAGAEVAAVLRGLTGTEPLVPALRRLLCAGHTSGSDLAWGVIAGGRAALTLAGRRPARLTAPPPGSGTSARKASARKASA